MAECAPTSVDDTMQRTRFSIEKILNYLGEPEFIELVIVTFDIPEHLKRIEKFCKIISQRLTLFLEQASLPYTPQSSEAPLVTTNNAVRFALTSAHGLLQNIYKQIYFENFPVEQTDMENLNSFLILVRLKLERLFQKTIWKEYY